jgi:hypothetical protein
MYAMHALGVVPLKDSVAGVGCGKGPELTENQPSRRRVPSVGLGPNVTVRILSPLIRNVKFMEEARGIE